MKKVKFTTQLSDSLEDKVILNHILKMYLVTGCAGLLGANFVNYLIEKCHKEVIGIDTLEGGYEENLHPSLIFYKFDLKDSEKLKEVFEKHSIEYIYIISQHMLLKV